MLASFTTSESISSSGQVEWVKLLKEAQDMEPLEKTALVLEPRLRYLVDFEPGTRCTLAPFLKRFIEMVG